MSRRSKRTDPKSGKAEPKSGKGERRHPPARRGMAPLPEVMLARRPAAVAPDATRVEASPPIVAITAHAEAAPPVAKRAARIVGAPAVDESELERRHLLSRLLESEGPAAVTRAATAYRKSGFQFPEEQLVQLKLLEHRDEAEVCAALDVLTGLLDQQAPIQLPVFEQRLKRLEDGADEAETRARAAELRRVLRT
ncbi:MAG TPA: hypothetical protein VER11_09710 [Polyangiaceae bacterium]|nr:hypothetical protein [Polyangiaceae bacterium]